MSLETRYTHSELFLLYEPSLCQEKIPQTPLFITNLNIDVAVKSIVKF